MFSALIHNSSSVDRSRPKLFPLSALFKITKYVCKHLTSPERYVAQRCDITGTVCPQTRDVKLTLGRCVQGAKQCVTPPPTHDVTKAMFPQQVTSPEQCDVTRAMYSHDVTRALCPQTHNVRQSSTSPRTRDVTLAICPPA